MNKYINIYIYIYIIYINLFINFINFYISYISIYTIKFRFSTDLHLWFDVWVPLAACSVNFLGKYLFLNRKAMFISETKLSCCFNLF